MIQQEGPGWRLAWDSTRSDFCVLIGGDGWAAELTEPEWRELVALTVELDHQHRVLVDRLMEEEAIELELDRGVWWGCLAGDRRSWSLSVVLSPLAGRGLEGHWSAPAAAAMVAAMRTLWDRSIDQGS